MRLKAIILSLLLTPLCALAAFTDAEKAEVYKWVQFSEITSDALREIALQIQEEGRIDRAAKADMLSAVFNAKRRGGMFFAALSSTPEGQATVLPDPFPTRAEFLQLARHRWESILFYTDLSVRLSAQSPSLARAAQIMLEAEALIGSFNWSLEFADPLYVDVPQTPWDESRTVVGPHGILLKSKHTLNRALQYESNAFEHLTRLYRQVEIWPSDTSRGSANAQLWRIVNDFADIDVLLTAAQAMHVDVMSEEHRAIISEDQAGSSNFRDVDFFRALLQVELLFSTDKAGMATNFRGRDFIRGAVSKLQNNNFGLLQASVLSVNTIEDSREFIAGESHQFMRDRSDFWGDLDTWAVTAFGFFDPLTPPAGAVPDEGGTSITCGVGTVLNGSQCEAVPTSCPVLDTDISVDGPSSAARYECKVQASG